MTRRLLLVLVLSLLLTGVAFATQGKYVRKSVSSVESVWIKPDALQGVTFDNDFFEKMVDFYIEVERFDYNVLPESMTKDFHSQSVKLTEFSTAKIGALLEETVVKEIVDVLNDPEVKQKRGTALKDEADFQTFAATKAKSLGLTTDELKVLMNSAYIYLPFITSMKQETDDKNNITLTLEGGIIWYHVVMTPDGNTKLEQVVAATTKGIGASEVGETYDFRFGNELKKVDAATYAQYNAVQAWCKNLGVKTKKIDDFLLTAQIVEADGGKYAAPIGFKEGVHLDDGFDLVEYMEDEDGKVVAERIGFLRICKTGDNKEDPNNYTYMKQYLGDKTDIGAVVMERPRLGLDLRVKAGYIMGMDIPKETTDLYNMPVVGLFVDESTPILKEDANSAVGVNVLFSYNLAPITGITQSFIDLDIEAALPMAEVNAEAAAVTYIISPYLGASKKFFFSRLNITTGLAAGLDMFNMNGTLTYSSTDYEYKYTISSYGVKANAALEYMWNPDLSFNLGLNYKYCLKPSKVAFEWEGTEIFSYSGSDISGAYEDLNLGGFGIYLGANYALSELPFNLFGFLDPLKKY